MDARNYHRKWIILRQLKSQNWELFESGARPLPLRSEIPSKNSDVIFLRHYKFKNYTNLLQCRQNRTHSYINSGPTNYQNPEKSTVYHSRCQKTLMQKRRIEHFLKNWIGTCILSEVRVSDFDFRHISTVDFFRKILDFTGFTNYFKQREARWLHHRYDFDSRYTI